MKNSFHSHSDVAQQKLSLNPMNMLDKHRLWEGAGMDRLILPKIPNSLNSPRSSPRLTRRNTSNDVLMRGTFNNDVTLKVPRNSYLDAAPGSSNNLVPASPGRTAAQEYITDSTVQAPTLTKSDLNGIIPDVTYGASGSVYSMEEPYDSDDDLRVSMTLPRIEKVLRDEGFRPTSITNQINRIKYRKGKDFKRKPVRPKIIVPKQTPQVSTSAPIRSERSPSPRPMTNRNALSPTPNRNALSPRPNMNLRRRSVQLSDDRDNSDADSLKSDSLSPRDFLNEQDVTMVHRSCSDYSRDIAQIRWVSQQQLEIGVLNVNPHYVPPRIVLASSNVLGSVPLCNDVVHQKDEVICNRYDFENSSYKDLTDMMENKLTFYLEGAKAKSVLIYCQGGAGYLYILKKKVVTAKKLLSQREEHKSMIQFWQDLGELLSKLEPSESVVHIGGVPLMDDEQGQQLVDTLKEIVYPNQVRFEAVDDETDEGRRTLGLYLDVDKYEKWKKEWQ